MSTAPAFGTPVIGQTEKALNAILDRQLAGTGVTEPQWVTLTLAVVGGGTVEGDQLASRVASVLQVSGGQARARIADLVGAGLLAGDGSAVMVTGAGRRLHGRVRAAVVPITERLWGDLPADDLETAGRVLSTVLERANAELARA